jgi:hypothetical protein
MNVGIQPLGTEDKKEKGVAPPPSLGDCSWLKSSFTSENAAAETTSGRWKGKGESKS